MTDSKNLNNFLKNLTEKQIEELKEIAFNSLLQNSEQLTKTLTESKEDKIKRLNDLNAIAKRELFLTNATNSLKFWLKKANTAYEEDFKNLIKELCDFIDNKNLTYWLLEKVVK